MVRVIYIGGLGRSGTTLLERMLGELPGVCPLGEVVHLWQRDLVDDESCGCGEPFSACDFWQAVGKRAFGGWQHVDADRVRTLRDAVERTRRIPRLAAGGLSSSVREYAGYFARLYKAASTVAHTSTVVDSSKHGALAWCLRSAPGIDLRVVHMVRDSRGVAYSWTRHVPRPEAGGVPMTRYSPGRTALLWNAQNAAFGLLRRCGTPVHRVRYEQLVRDPAGTLHQVAEFAGLDPGPLRFLSASSVRLRGCHSAAGNPMRFLTGDVPLRADEEWRAALPPGQRLLVGALTRPLLNRYGYGRR